MRKSKGSMVRKMKRMAMRAQGQTFSDRLREAVRTGTAVKDVNFTTEKPVERPFAGGVIREGHN